MQIRLAVAEFRRRWECRLLSRQLDRMAGDRGPDSYRTPEFLAAEVEFGIALARWAEAQYAIGHNDAPSSHSRAEQIYTALVRFLPKAQLDERERMVIERRFESLRQGLARLQNQYTTA
ncbi:MAG TPA: hypothetical protein VMA31_13970 [Bryobacteraceae bacterium]|nr:hypothetical protein [Bryobacteraceae bacterium]